MSEPRTVTLLHLSDLHFGRYHRFSSDGGQDSLLERLRVDLDGLRANEGLRPDLIIVSGDLAEYGKKAEFERATRFLQKLSQTLELPARRVVIVPGNHDINWSLSKSYFEECIANEETPKRPYAKKLKFFQEAFAVFYSGERDIVFTDEQPWSLFEYPELGVVVAGMNSVIAESHEDHFGYLGEEQLRWFAEKLRSYKERGFLRLGVMHHDPRDRRGGGETKRDQSDLKRLLSPSLNVLLHGDIHEETDEALGVALPVFGIGSLGVKLEQRPAEVPNVYQLLQVHAGGVRRALRAYAPDQSRFLPSARADAAGTATIVEIPVAFDRVDALGQAAAPKREADLSALVEQYRRSIVKDQRMQTVGDLLGRDVLGAPMTATDVLRLFVPQDVMREDPARHFRHERTRDWLHGEEPAVSDVQQDAFGERDVRDDAFSLGSFADSVTTALSRGWVYLLGAPGAGKTSLTRWILLSLCVPGERIEGFADDLVPMRIDMRLFDDAYRKASGQYSLFDHLDRMLAERFLNLRGEPLRELAKQGRLYFLFDGLDEVIDEEQRRTYAEMISGLALADEYARCRGVVTNRVVGAEVAQAVFEGSGFTTYTLRDFTEAQQDRFLDAWHALVFAHEPEVLRHRRTRLSWALEASPSLRMLCGNPLCCALLAYLNRDEELPEGRHLLYQRILERLAHQWNANKGLAHRTTSFRFDLPDKLSFLRRLAWYMMETGGAEAGNVIVATDLVDFTRAFCEEKWAETAESARLRAEALIGDLRGRNEVLAWLGGDLYGFSHRAFLEYLVAARAVEKHGRPGGIVELGKWFARHWREPGWEETLLLTCGVLREVDQGPTLVVRVLQELPGGDRSVVYRELDEYLCFCIKALGELRSLERGVVRDFAEEINGILEYEIQCDPAHWLSAHRFLEPFRRCAGKWPDVERLIYATDKRIDEGNSSFDEAYPLWIAAAGRTDRLRVLLNALEVCRTKLGPDLSAPYPLCSEAARLGAWCGEEVNRLVEAAALEDEELNRYNILACTIHTPGMLFRGDEPIIGSFSHLMESASAPDIRMRAAWTMFKAGVQREAALTILRNFLYGNEAHYRRGAARMLLSLGFIDDALDTIAAGATHDVNCLDDLMRLAHVNEKAAKALQEIAPRVRQQEEMRTYVWSFLFGIRRKCPIIAREAMSKRLRKENAKSAQRCLHFLVNEPKLAEFIATQYTWLLPRIKDSGTRTMAVIDVLRLDPKHGGAPLQHLWRILLDSNDLWTAIGAARQILQRCPNHGLREIARQKMLIGLRPTVPERNRLSAAGALGADDSAARSVYEALAANASDEVTRYAAAKTIGNMKALAHLADRAHDANVKESAREALDLYTHIHRLLSVGRPRRARVFLHNQFAGMLEEITVNGGTKFTYDKTYREKPGAKPLAPNLPLRAEPYDDPNTLHPFFANLLPEGSIFDQTARRLGLPKTDRFGMLLHVGEDVMGAVQVLPEETN
ncbi:MAG: HipA N-terminal domain-containing protein [Polyangiaceae bacterium]|nr:HipA N-terminal domain-containing protein [Polyangiaceae bacterium]